MLGLALGLIQHIGHVSTSSNHVSTSSHVNTSSDHVSTSSHVNISSDHVSTSSHVNISSDHVSTSLDHESANCLHCGSFTVRNANL